MVRKPGWERSFVDAMQAHMATPFGWGSSDCLVVVADICAAITGRNPLPKRLRRYDTEGAAGALLEALGLADVEAALARFFPPIACAQARRGDCGIVSRTVDGNAVKAAVIVLGPTVVGKAERGNLQLPRRALVAAYAIGAF